MSGHPTAPVHVDAATDFLRSGRLAIVGASDARDSFGRTVYEQLRTQGIDVVAVHPAGGTVAGDPSHARLLDVPGHVDGAIVMVAAPGSVDVVRQVAERGIPRVWLFKGAGGTGASSPEAVALAMELGLDVVPGACPLMFVEHPAFVHRLHRAVRRARGHLTVSSA
jgi:predicted CoA-binding protein